jgi:hypothetical protein
MWRIYILRPTNSGKAAVLRRKNIIKLPRCGRVAAPRFLKKKRAILLGKSEGIDTGMM